ncbi:serine/threonine-protein kinase [Pyxidicoccus caerfyrddinensis]|uniref:serine/threonine-protein kinase n=1 Tax=Pyxidicoccus caerfyrddinensis TaxID=2709663 RepID=UPI0013DA71D5|nr:serine/threonine-protein kinase [Pyxidicoccus caerfyrddinensis]
MSTEHMLEAPAGTDIAGFAVDGLLGVGGYGVVYRATRGTEVVALKLQSLEHLGVWAEREVSLLPRLEHRNVVGFRECGLHPPQAPQWCYLAMEYVRGRTLSRWVEEENPGARRAAKLLLGLARGLEATHAAEVLHRDIKESNVVVREEDGEPVLVDFGVGARAGAPRLTAGVLPPGTPRYRSPEALAFQRDSRPGARYVATPADDLYALGVVFYWMLTARHPFAGAETPAEVEAVISAVPAAPRALNARGPWELEALCLRLLAKRPEARGTAKALREALEVALAGADARWDVPLCEAHSELPSPDGHPESLEAWLPAREAWEEEVADRDGPPRRGRHARTRRWEEAVPLEDRPALRVRAPLVPEGTPPASVMFRATAVLGMAVGLVTAVLMALEWRPSVWLSELAGTRPGRDSAVAPVKTPEPPALKPQARQGVARAPDTAAVSPGPVCTHHRPPMPCAHVSGTLEATLHGPDATTPTHRALLLSPELPGEGAWPAVATEVAWMPEP